MAWWRRDGGGSAASVGGGGVKLVISNSSCTMAGKNISGGRGSSFEIPNSDDVDPAYAMYLAEMNKVEVRGPSYHCSDFFDTVCVFANCMKLNFKQRMQLNCIAEEYKSEATEPYVFKMTKSSVIPKKCKIVSFQIAQLLNSLKVSMSQLLLSCTRAIRVASRVAARKLLDLVAAHPKYIVTNLPIPRSGEATLKTEDDEFSWKATYYTSKDERIRFRDVWTDFINDKAVVDGELVAITFEKIDGEVIIFFQNVS
ncbi:hypothetical protein ACQ4PT_064354 [Festuca glaucescens]